MMIDEEITMKLNETIKIINQKIDELTNHLNEREDDIKNQKVQAVNGLNNVFVPYSDGVVPSEAWDKFNALRSTYDEILKKESVFLNEKEVTLESISNLEAKRTILKDALKAYGEVATNKEIVETPKNENNISSVKPVIEPFMHQPEETQSNPEPVIHSAPIEIQQPKFVQPTPSIVVEQPQQAEETYVKTMAA